MPFPDTSYYLQAHIQQSRSSGDDAISREFPAATPTSAPPSIMSSSMPRGSLASSGTLVDSPLEPNYLEPVRTSRSITLRQTNGGSSRLSSGPLSPQTPSPISVLPSPASNSVYYANDIVLASLDAESVINNNVRTSSCVAATLIIDSPTTVTMSQSNGGDLVNNGAAVLTTPGTPTSPIAYMNLTSPTSPTSPYQAYDSETNYARLDALLKSEQLHLYMNVEPENSRDKEELDLPATTQSNIDYEGHCYANLGLGPGELDIPLKPRAVLVSHPTPAPISSMETPPAEHRAPIRQVNYIVLDLDRGTDTVPSLQTTPLSPVGSICSAAPVESPRATTQTSLGYATIDFDKTAALSHSVNPKLDLDTEGSRKTRHNSTIKGLPVKQNSSSISD